MKLSLDIFQLIGVSPGATANNMLMILERRLEKCRYHDFSEETLRRRSKLLTEYSKILLNTETINGNPSSLRCNESLDDKQREIILAPGDEIAGLLLALEASHYDECLYLGIQLLSERRQIKKVSTSRDSDIKLIVGYSALEYSRVLINKRYYQYCSEILKKALQHVKGDLLLAKIEADIDETLERITPFRILDLLSRDMDEAIRDQGIILLMSFVRKRGGLDNESNLIMDDGEFKSFFRQIRYFLTVQEQIDLFETWYEEKSETAGFLLAIALVASGFAQRKPSRLITAISIMKNLNSAELDSIIRYTRLLLGKVDMTTERSQLIDQIGEQQQHCIESEAELAELCGDCREWLSRDVLEGYRDIDVDADLEAYFSDKDVTKFIEALDKKIVVERKSNRLFGPKDKNLDDPQNNILNTADKGNKMVTNKKSLPVANLMLSTATNNRIRTGIMVVLFIGGIGVLTWSLLTTQNQMEKQEPSTVISRAKDSKRQLLKDIAKKSHSDIVITQTGKQATPDKSAIQSLLSEWLRLKAQILLGSPTTERVKNFASKNAIERLLLERKDDKAQGHKQIISAKPIDIEILNTSSRRIEVIATIAYSDKRINNKGKVIAQTPSHVFKKIYTLVNIGGKWLVE